MSSNNKDYAKEFGYALEKNEVSVKQIRKRFGLKDQYDIDSRKCLGCEKTFTSKHKGNRLCEICRYREH